MNAGDLMSPHVATVRADATVGEAVRLMLDRRVSGLPVVDAANRLLGIVTEGDFLRRGETGTQRRRPRWLEVLLGPGRLAADYVQSHARKLSDVMTTEVWTIAEDTPVAEIVALMEERRVKRLPVVRDGVVVGIVSRADLLHALAPMLDQAPPAVSDAAIRARLTAEIAKQPWAPHATMRLAVRDGVVRLSGMTFDERERQALRVLAETTPGVKAVEDHLMTVEPVSGVVIGEGAAGRDAGGRQG